MSILELDSRNTLFPIKDHDIWAAYKKQAACMWHVHEVDMTKDRADWDKLNADEKHFLKMVLAFFASSDLIVNENLAKRFTQEVQLLEARITYKFQEMMENIHSEMYATLIDVYIQDPKEKDYLFNAVKTIPIIEKKAAWARKWIGSDASFAERLVAFSAVEGIFFSGSFCAIYWIRERGILPGLTKSNTFIARDEGLHTDFAVLLHQKLKDKCHPDVMKQIIQEAVDLEIEFITEALPCRLIGMNAGMMREYIKFVANRLLKQYNALESYPNVQQPFTFMDRIGLSMKSNFFESKPDAYGNQDTRHTEDEDPYAGV